MKSQWQCLLENIGEWHGSFTRLSPQGEVIEDTPTLVSLEGLNDNKTVHQIVRRLPPNLPPEEKVFKYSSLGRGILLFDDGAFSSGSIQLAPFSQFGAELGLIAHKRRLRLVQLFNNGQLERLTLIREKLQDATTPEKLPLTVDDLVGTWQGEACTIYPDWRSPDTYQTTLKIERGEENELLQQLTTGKGSIASKATINGKVICFDSGYQVLLLPDGASSTCPVELKANTGFFLEVGWLKSPTERQRLIRTYNSQGEWVNLTLVTEYRLSQQSP
ncbi:MAG: DUF3598 family protein [Chroococcus sp. CMT-3BRIN-NPC107]|jgi:hypothetical protein|nr:DUF3598 family protein [Chroococcus sp. CMT-3BRIN-NPC107]